MKRRKTLCALTSGLLAVLLLAGCAGDPAVTPGSTESESESTTTAAAEPETTPLELVRDGKTEYSIVYPDSPSSGELNASVQLQTLFRSKLGVRIESDTDYTIREGQPEKRILLGATCAAESEEAYRDLQYHAFRIAVKGSNLCIAAYSEDGWLAALEWMDNTLFGGATESDGKKSVTVNITEVTGGNREYPIKSWTIAGQALNAYRLIWATEDQQSIAETLRETLAEQTGWVLPVFRDTETEPSDCEILLGETNRAESQAVAAPAALTYRHENAVPAIISREKWEQAQFLLRDNVERNIRAGQNAPHHRYTGLIKCGDCGSSFVCRKRVWKDNVRYEYTCNGYHRYGKENCSPHRVDEAQLDKLIYDELLEMKEGAEANYKSIEHDVKKWLSQKNTSEKKVKALSDKLKQRKSDQEQILLERIRDREHADIYTGMLTKCEKDIANITAELAAIQDYDATIRKRKAEMKSSIDILGEIVKEGAISDSNLRLLIDEIVISECGGKLSINIHLKAAFRSHLDIYDENGQLTDKAFAVS